MKTTDFTLIHRTRRTLPLALAAGLAFALSGCMVGPDYHRPQVSVPAQWKELPGWTQAEPSAAEAPKGDWWTAFHDPLLDELEPLVTVSNQTVRQSYANYQEALAEVRVARAGLFPTLGVTGSATRERASTTTTTGSAARIVNAGSLEANASWAPDLWGEVRRQIEEQSATAQASEATLANAQLSEQIALANAVIDLRITDADIDLLTATVAAYKDSLRVVSDQDAAGTVAPSDLLTARTQLENAQASLIALGVSRAQYEHAIAVLVGRNPEDVTIPHSERLPILPEIPAGVPSTILQRRPDVATAERQMASANAAIGVAVAAYYPSISLSALDGFTQSPLSGLLHISNYVWSLGASATETIFDGGLRSADVDAARASYDASVANYRGTVLTAFQDVENDLSGLRILAQQSAVLESAVRDATRATQIAQNEYEAGTVDYTTVVTAQATQLSTQQSALTVQQSRLLDAAALIGDLGGGWNGQMHDARHPDRVDGNANPGIGASASAGAAAPVQASGVAAAAPNP
ncbi:efflux transporter outer membrane subunit [Paraburkholderia tropica]|uniref:NodT family efflux transporter outer membrane factor (OMF) lipoprotein n=1 Tax=Paraburkholderia tropica TaxID=92647 RepID=A0ABX5MVB6_9BURK|nr:efflux transporter outer membrane subunit [Paraburkholderia tropica]MBB3001144.1 NodT family efflux transporter outer membrane factor (OMF) lipoprotein [Paraburkholderia tropica]MBB6320776.1 NodT family efflux transporter outer membrane factor (OMF) lipoprotein [Paraburkholderia tropica]MDE1140777.1 efflux transporter outer membrane subunit [Paraburkholderia tropica]PXX19071.1 NodT family efflux transporter outer membrane factor (OMF) lipoprotein [Paraburkholderia tropica]PZW88094.1 NodT fa